MNDNSNLYDPALILRDAADGQFYHPHLPSWPDEEDEDKDIRPLILEQGFEVARIEGGEDDGFTDEALSNGSDDYWSALRNWNPDPPAGDGWLLVAIADTEDGPFSWWVRKVAA